MTKDFWRGKRVLLTGHTGFKGSWLSTWLKLMDVELVGYSLPPATGPSLFESAHVADGMTSIEGDVRDLDRLRSVVDQFQPEIILHLAAQALVRPSYDDPINTFSTNVMGTANVLEAARQARGLRAMVMVTSDKAYENQEWVWAYRETDRLGGRDPYSNSKACAELVVQAYRDSFYPVSDYAKHGVAVASARAGNVIGGGDWAVDRLVPDALRAFGEGRPVSIRSPHATRPWQFVLEALSGYLLLAEKLWTDGPRYSEGWNFGPDIDDVKPVSWIVENMTAKWGEGASWVNDNGTHPHEANLLMLDCAKSKRLLGWYPRLKLDEALDWITEWHRAWMAGESVRLCMENQILRYEEMA